MLLQRIPANVVTWNGGRKVRRGIGLISCQVEFSADSGRAERFASEQFDKVPSESIARRSACIFLGLPLPTLGDGPAPHCSTFHPGSERGVCVCVCLREGARIHKHWPTLDWKPVDAQPPVAPAGASRSSTSRWKGISNARCSAGSNGGGGGGGGEKFFFPLFFPFFSSSAADGRREGSGGAGRTRRTKPRHCTNLRAGGIRGMGGGRAPLGSPWPPLRAFLPPSPLLLLLLPRPLPPFFPARPPENVRGRSQLSPQPLELLSAASAAKSGLGPLRWQRAAARRGPEAPAPC